MSGMGTKKPPAAAEVRSPEVANALFTKAQQRVLAVLFGYPERSFYANEVIALAGCGTGAVQRELARLEAAGLVTVTRVGRQKHYQANRAAPVFEELRGLVRKTTGLIGELPHAREDAPALSVAEPRLRYRKTVARKRAGANGLAEDAQDTLVIGQQIEVSRAALHELAQRYHIRRLVLFGSAARDELKPDSDIDLMVEFKAGQAPSLWLVQDMHDEFSRLFGGRPVDIVPPEILLNPYRRKTIERDQTVLYDAA
jgi:predicted nucleotidyltransferase